MTCTKPHVPDTASWDDLIDTGIEIHFSCGNFVTIPEAIIRHPQASRDADRCKCPYCGAGAQIIQRVTRLRNDNDTPIVFG